MVYKYNHFPHCGNAPLLRVHHGPEHLMSGNTIFIALSILEEGSVSHTSMLLQEFLKLVSSRDLGKGTTKADFDFKMRFAAFVNS